MSTDKVSTPKLVSGKVRRNLPNGSIDFISLEETEKYLGVPSTNGYVLASTTSGVRSWVAMSQGGGGGGLAGNFDGGVPSSVYGGIEAIDGGSVT